MKAYQLSVPAENRPGSLARITEILAKEKINLRSITISSHGDSGVINIMVDDPKQGQKALVKGGLTVSLKEVIAVSIEDKPGCLDKLVQLLNKENINIENAYGFVLESWKNAIFVVEIEQLERAREVLKKGGFEVLDAEAMSSLEPFHYMRY